MKITKRQLKRIIREEKQKLIKEQGTVGIPYEIQDTIDGWAYRSSEELNGQLSQLDRDWNLTPEIIDAIQRALDNMKAEFEGWRNQ